MDETTFSGRCLSVWRRLFVLFPFQRFIVNDSIHRDNEPFGRFNFSGERGKEETTIELKTRNRDFSS